MSVRRGDASFVPRQRAFKFVLPPPLPLAKIQVYFIVGGVGNSEGCVITRSWDDAVMGIWSIGPDR